MRALGFDFDHTLGIDNKLERVAFLRLLEPQAPLVEEIERVDALLAQQRSGAFTIDEAVRRFVRERGVRDAEPYVERYKRSCVEMVEWFVIPEPGARDLCTLLASRAIPHALLTNGWSPLQERKASVVHFCGEVIVSADIGAQKPSPAAFDALARTLGVPHSEIGYVGDSPEADIAGALEAGLQAIWFDAEHAQYPSAAPALTHVIHRLAELQDLL